MASTSAETFDFIIVGGGIAGLRAAMTLGRAGRVLILTKAGAAESNTGYAQGGIAAAIGAGDSPTLHAADTVRAGDGLCDEAAVRVLAAEGPRYVRELIDWGVRFDEDDAGNPALALEAVHSVRRILHAGDATVREIGRALWEQVKLLPAVSTASHALVTDLIVERRAVRGVRFFDSAGVRRKAVAGATLLATGGAGQIFRETTNPGVATGDGIAMAYHAGARVVDLEFVQFHPTALSLAGAPRFLISEAVRGEGAHLVNARQEPFMARYHADGDLAPRDVVARSIAREAARTGGPVFLALSHLDRQAMRRRFPTIAEMCRQVGLDFGVDPIPVGPAAHYLMGGIDTDEWGRTSLDRLYAAGESACTGVHGANRLASNSLLEGLVFGARAGEAMQQPPAAAPLKAHRRVAGADHDAERVAGAPIASDQDVRDLMWRSAGLFRTRRQLQDVVATFDATAAGPRDPGTESGDLDADGWRRFNLITVVRLVAAAALRREESRGGHFREDFPSRDDLHWKVHLVEAKSVSQ